MSMLSKELQGAILQKSSLSDKLTYPQMRDFVISWVNQQSQLIRPTPMDIGVLDKDGSLNYEDDGGKWESWKEETYKWFDAEIDRLYKGKGGKGKSKGKGKSDGCFNCGGPDHWSRECPYPPKGKGKGKDGKATGGQKAFGKGGTEGGQPGWVLKGKGKL